MPLPLVGFVRRRNDAASQRGFTQFHFDPLGFFLHSNPAKLADEMKNFHRPAFIVLRGGNFSTLQVKVHGFSRSMETIAIVRAMFLPGYEANAWIGIGAPKNTPVEIINKLNREINAGLANPQIAARVTELASTAFVASPSELDRLVVEYTKKWGKVIRAAGIKAE
jgi:Tripartite tricarboxylate transporter family receptor